MRSWMKQIKYQRPNNNNKIAKPITKILNIGQQIYPNIWKRFIKILLKKQKNMPKETILQPKKKYRKKI